METSLVSVPANPDAVMQVKSLMMDGKVSPNTVRMVFAKHGIEIIDRSVMTWLGQEVPQEKPRMTTWMGQKVPVRNF